MFFLEGRSFQKAIELDGNNYDAYVDRANLKLKPRDCADVSRAASAQFGNTQ